MRTLIVSDIHLGSRHCLHPLFGRFLDTLPADATLVLNGDTVDSRRRRMKPEHALLLQRLAGESARRRVVWISGNHDEGYRLPESGRIEFVTEFDIGKRLHVQHGFYFDHIMPYHKVFIFLFRLAHRLRILLGAEPIHVAQYAKKWPFLYSVLRRNVQRHAFRYAAANGFEAITCGHTHYPEEVFQRGIRYLNTGSWTELPIYYIDVGDTSLTLRRFEG